MSVLSREEFCLTVLHQWGSGTAECRNKLEEHDADQRQRIAKLEADQKRVVATIDGMARLLGGRAPDLPRLVDQIIAAHAAALKERDEAQQAFSDHTIIVSAFLNDIYGILIDPLADGVRTVKETCDEIRAAALRSREELQELASLRLQVQEGWQPIETAPKDGTPIQSSRTVRYLPYKPDGKRQMRAEGRWQERNEYGWENCKEDPAEWRAMASEEGK